jgi:exodeoxyribonuclease V gamma subunit
VIQKLLPTVEDIVAATEEIVGAGAAGTADVRVRLDDGRMLSGTVAGIRGDAVLTTTFSRVAPRQRLAAWVRLLALAASAPDVPRRAVTVGRRRSGEGVTVATIPPPMADAPSRRAFARTRLVALVELYDRALCEPLPIAVKASAAYARAVRDGGDAAGAARTEWEGEWNRAGEAADAEHVLAFGRDLPFAALGAEDPRADERGPGWEPSERTRFGRYALRLWADLLDVEEVDDR